VLLEYDSVLIGVSVFIFMGMEEEYDSVLMEEEYDSSDIFSCIQNLSLFLGSSSLCSEPNL
jgi:hypothetical protein